MRRTLLAAFAVLGLAGCGDGGGAGPAAPRAAEQLLTGRDVARYSPDSPARAVLAWWRAAQFASTSEYVDAYADELRSELARNPSTHEALNHFAAAIRFARPRVLSVSRSGDHATVYTRIEYRQPVGTQRYVALTVPRAFVLVDERGWRLMDDEFVQDSLPAELQRQPG